MDNAVRAAVGVKSTLPRMPELDGDRRSAAGSAAGWMTGNGILLRTENGSLP